MHAAVTLSPGAHCFLNLGQETWAHEPGPEYVGVGQPQVVRTCAYPPDLRNEFRVDALVRSPNLRYKRDDTHGSRIMKNIGRNFESVRANVWVDARTGGGKRWYFEVMLCSEGEVRIGVADRWLPPGDRLRVLRIKNNGGGGGDLSRHATKPAKSEEERGACP